MNTSSAKRAHSTASVAVTAPSASTARPRHQWIWGMETGGTVRRTALVRVVWIEGREGPLVATGNSEPLLATLSVCDHCGVVRADVAHPDDGPTLHAYGVDLAGLLVGAGSPRCESIPRREEVEG